MANLKPCPFCGEVPYMERERMWSTHYDGTTHGYVGSYKYDIHCDNCGCTIPLGDNSTIYLSDEEAKQNAINAWNKRADAVEIIRCKDCKMFLPNNNGFAFNSPTGHCFHHDIDRLKVDYCSDGDRRTD